jgi:hypothetical protein
MKHSGDSSTDAHGSSALFPATMRSITAFVLSASRRGRSDPQSTARTGFDASAVRD